MTEPNQNKTFSIVKGIGIILVVIAHSALNTQLRTFVYLINIAIFFFVAGYFFKDEYLQHPLLFFKKKLVRFYVPWVVYGILFVLLHNVFLSLNLIDYDYHQRIFFKSYTNVDVLLKSLDVLSFFKWKEPLLAPLWFLFGMFSGLIVFYSISWFANKISNKQFELIRAILVVLLMTIGFLGDAYNLPFSILYRPLVISGLIYMGKIYWIFEKHIKLSPLIALLCFVGLLIATAFDYQINIGGMVFGNPVIFLIISCSGSYMLLTLARFIDAKTQQPSKVLNFIGKYSFSIMALHYITFKLVILFQIWVCNYPAHYLSYYPVIAENTKCWWVVYTFVGVLVPLFLASLATTIKLKLVEKFNFIRK